METANFDPEAAPQVTFDLIRSPILGGAEQLLFYETNRLEASFWLKMDFLLGFMWLGPPGVPA